MFFEEEISKRVLIGLRTNSKSMLVQVWSTLELWDCIHFASEIRLSLLADFHFVKQVPLTTCVEVLFDGAGSMTK